MINKNSSTALYWQALLDRLIRKENTGAACVALIQTIPPQVYREAPVLQLQHAIALVQLERFDEALSILTRLEGRPGIDAGMLYLNLGACYSKQFNPERALEFYQRAQKTGLDLVSLYRNMIGAYLDMGQLAPAQSLYETHAPRFSDDHGLMNAYADFLLATQQYEKGFRLYHHRWLRPNAIPPPIRPDLPIWDGKTPVRSLLVIGEQGIGDEIVYSAYLPELADRVQEMTVAYDARLFPLLSRTWPKLHLLDWDQLKTMSPQETGKRWDAWTHAADAGQYATDAIGWKKGYLQVDKAKAHRLREKYQQLFPGKKLVGISWHSVRKTGSGLPKNIPLEQWQPLLENKHCQFITLQYGDMSDDLRSVHNKFGIHIYQDEEIDNFKDLDGLAAQIHALDLTISISNTTAHLAAATHAPTWAILPQHLFWYWGFLGGSTNWYPDVRIFRFMKMTEYSPNMMELAQALNSFTTNNDNNNHFFD